MKKDQHVLTLAALQKALDAVSLVEASLNDICPFDPDRTYSPKEREPLSRAFKHIGTSYAHYFNFSNDRGKAINAFKKYHQEEAEGFFLGVEGEKRVPEENVQSFISQYLMERKLEIEGLKLPENKKFRDELIGSLRKQSGLSLRRIAEVLHINREVVRKAVALLSKEKEPSPPLLK